MRRRRRKADPAERGRDRAAGWVTLVLGLALTAFLFWKNRQGMPFVEYYLLNTALLLWAPLVAVLLFLRREVSDFGMTVGDLRPGLLTALLLLALFVPVILVFSPMTPFQQYYVRQFSAVSGGSGVLGWDGRLDYGRLVFHEAVLGFYMFAWEWYFRGFLLWGLKLLMPVVWAALLQALAFALLHWGKPWPEVASSFFGALLLAAVALRFRSFLPCFVLHWAISASFDAAVLYHHFNRDGR